MDFAAKVREIFISAAGLAPHSELADSTRLDSAGDDDTFSWFWRQIENELQILVTKAQRDSLQTIGLVVNYLKYRVKVTA